MTVAQKAKKWTLMAETEDSFQRWQEAIKAAVTKAGKYLRRSVHFSPYVGVTCR